MLRVRLFGGLTLVWDDVALPTIPGTAARSLFAYLVTYRDRAHTRDLLAGTFWPDLPDATARRRLSKALWQIRHTFRAAFPQGSQGEQDKAGSLSAILVAQDDTLQLNPDLPLRVDKEEFEQQLVYSSHQKLGPAAEGLLRAVELYRGEFLAGYYHDWAIVEREQLHGMLLEALGRLVAGYKGRGEYEPALRFARWLVAEEPRREGAHREVMQLCHLLGDDAGALKQFEICRQSLARELGVEPSPETVALADEIATRSRLSRRPLLPATARPVTTLLLERPDRLPLVGRRKELAELLRQVEATAEGAGGLTIVYGEAGVGKSRLLREVAENARWRGVRTAWGRCYELAAPPAYQPLVEALWADPAALDESTLEELWRAELSRILPGLAIDDGSPPSLSPEEERRRLLEAMAQGFLALVEAAPHLVLLEDAQWMDPASLEALRYLLPRLGEAPLLVVVTARTEELGGQRAEVLSAMESTRLARRLELGGLSQAETEELVQRALDLEEPAPRFSDRLYAETEGNPFFLIDTLWALVEEGLLYRDEAGRWSTQWDESTEDYAELPLPASVVQSIVRRLDHLPGELNELLDLAAVIGRGVDFSLWRAASRRDEADLLMAGEELGSRGLLVADPTALGGADYVFAHDQIRRVAYRRLAPPRRRSYHRRVAQALTDLAPDEPAALAYHWTRAEEWERAADYHQQAGDRARAVYAHAEAVAHYTQALDALARLPGSIDAARKYELHLAREAVRNFMGDRQEQAEDLNALQALAQAQNDARRQTEVALRQAHYAEITGDYPAAIEMAQVAVRLAHSQDQQWSLHRTYHEAVGHLQWGEALSRQGAYETARIHFLRAQDLALAGQRATSEEGAAERSKLYLRDRVAGAHKVAAELLKSLEADSFCCLGGVCWHLGDSSGAEMHYEQALTIYREIGNQWGEAKVANGLGVLAWSRGDPDEASECFERSLRIYHEIGHRRGLVQAFGNLADMVMYRGDYSGAQRLFDRTVRMCREIGEPWIEGGILNNLGIAADRLGVYTEAAAFLEHALRVRHEIGDRQGQAEGLSDLSLLYHHMGDDETALDYGEQALDLIEELNNPFMKGFVLTRMAHVLVNLDRPDQATTAYQEALHLRRKGGQIHLIAETLAGLARVSLVREELERALARTEEILEILGARSPRVDPVGSHGGTSPSDSVVVAGHDLGGADEPMRVYLTCYRVLRANGDPRAKRVLSLTHDLLQRQAAKIDDEKLRSSFLTNVLVHRETVAASQELQASQQESLTLTEKPVTVSLPRADAPLGRPVREDEFVTVTWTVAAPEDETIAGKVARRRHRVLRLLREAQAQGAAPTHRHLAEALGVSRRTIERDMAALQREHLQLPATRGKLSE